MRKYYFLIDSMLWWGAERVVSNLVKEHVLLWEDVYLFTLIDGLFYDIPKEVHYIPMSNVKNPLLTLILVPYFVFKFRRLLKIYGLEDWISFLEISNYIHVLSKKNAFISFRIHLNYFKWLFWFIHKILIRLLYPKAKKIIVNSRENKLDLAKFLSIDSDKIDVRYNPIDREKIKILSKEKIEVSLKEKLKNKKIFITTWRLVWQKHHEKIIEALNEYNKKNNNRMYLIIWDGPKRWEFESLSKSFWLENKILFLWQQKNVFKYLKQANLYLYASEIEWFPNALLEARELWLKIISSDFKTWAREVILWEDTDTIWKDLVYPVEWEYWVLIDWNNYVQQIQKYLSFEY